MYMEKYLKQYYRGLRNDSAVKCTGCSFRRPAFYPQYPYGGSKTSLTPVLEDSMSSSCLNRCCMQAVHTQTCRQNTNTIN